MSSLQRLTQGGARSGSGAHAGPAASPGSGSAASTLTSTAASAGASCVRPPHPSKHSAPTTARRMSSSFHRGLVPARRRNQRGHRVLASVRALGALGSLVHFGDQREMRTGERYVLVGE